MAGGKGYKRRWYKGRDKYSVEQTLINATVSSSETTVVDVVAPTTVEGMRKVKHLTVSCVSGGANTYGLLWALFYLPAGMTPPGFNAITGPLIEPNQFVLNAGMIDHDAGPIRISSPVSRNLNSGDRIVLLVRAIANATFSIPLTGLVRYAITLQ